MERSSCFQELWKMIGIHLNFKNKVKHLQCWGERLADMTLGAWPLQNIPMGTNELPISDLWELFYAKGEKVAEHEICAIKWQVFPINTTYALPITMY